MVDRQRGRHHADFVAALHQLWGHHWRLNGHSPCVRGSRIGFRDRRRTTSLCLGTCSCLTGASPGPVKANRAVATCIVSRKWVCACGPLPRSIIDCDVFDSTGIPIVEHCEVQPTEVGGRKKWESCSAVMRCSIPCHPSKVIRSQLSQLLIERQNQNKLER